ncbi:MAG: response regulator transcription factor [Azospirillaceae bacterium]|nr:response regulator transcription factor [Azospirillaceae bacterium]
MRCLLIEPNMAIAGAIARELRKGEITCDHASAQQLRDLDEGGLANDYVAVLVGGIDEPATWISHLRRRQVNVIIISLLECRSVAETIDHLEAGADDVLAKPINGGETAARLHAARRRVHGHATSQLQIGRLTVYLDGRDPEIDGARLRLSHREHAIFQVLALNAGRVVSKEHIYGTVYGLSDSDPMEKVIDVYICKLRKKIAATTGCARYIETIYGRGYKLEAPAEDQQAFPAAMADCQPISLVTPGTLVTPGPALTA